MARREFFCWNFVARKEIIITSADIIIELGCVLRYPRVQALFGLSEGQI